MVFYGQNTFYIRGDHDWKPVATWVKSIGRVNRSYLTSLKVTMPDEYVWPVKASPYRRFHDLDTPEIFFLATSNGSRSARPGPVAESLHNVLVTRNSPFTLQVAFTSVGQPIGINLGQGVKGFGYPLGLDFQDTIEVFRQRYVIRLRFERYGSYGEKNVIVEDKYLSLSRIFGWLIIEDKANEDCSPKLSGASSTHFPGNPGHRRAALLEIQFIPT